MWYYCIFICVILTYSVVPIIAQFTVPNATVEVFYPSGLRVSIPDMEGIKLFAFHAKVNEEMNGREGGTFSRDIVKAKNGRWTFYDAYAKLNVGDTLYYWTYVDYFNGRYKLAYINDDQTFTVTELLPKPGSTTKKMVPTHTSPLPPPITVDPEDPDSPVICQISITTVKGKSSCKGKLIFDSKFDEFSSSKNTNWNIEKKFASAPDYEFVLYEEHRRTLSVENGQLKITPVLTDDIYGERFVTQSSGLDLGNRCTGLQGSQECSQTPQAWSILPPVTSSQISTKGKFYFKYGRVEIKARLPRGDWLYPELFLNPENQEYGPNYASGQIRIAFVSGNEANSRKLYGGVILGPSEFARQYTMKQTASETPWSNELHTYTVLWKPDSISFSVDGIVYGIIFPPDGGFSSLANILGLTSAPAWHTGSPLAPFDKEMHIVLGVGAGGHNFEDRTDSLKPYKNKDPKGQNNFYKDRYKWISTWGDNAKLIVESVKVWAI